MVNLSNRVSNEENQYYESSQPLTPLNWEQLFLQESTSWIWDGVICNENPFQNSRFYELYWELLRTASLFHLTWREISCREEHFFLENLGIVVLSVLQMTQFNRVTLIYNQVEDMAACQEVVAERNNSSTTNFILSDGEPPFIASLTRSTIFV